MMTLYDSSADDNARIGLIIRLTKRGTKRNHLFICDICLDLGVKNT